MRWLGDTQCFMQNVEAGTLLHRVLAQVPPVGTGPRLTMIEAKHVTYDVVEAPAAFQMARRMSHERFEHFGA